MLFSRFFRGLKKSWNIYYTTVPLRQQMWIALAVVFILIILISSHGRPTNDVRLRRKKYTVHGRNVDSGYLKHVFKVMRTFGYDRTVLNDDWDILWSHDYPFTKLKDELLQIKPNQMVNHIPGSGYITNKMNLAKLNAPFVPQAFLLPKELPQLLEHKANNPKSTYILKSNNHRGIKIVSDINSLKNSNNSFAQLYISNPLLIDNHKFDIGVYTFITSINPLRIYTFNDVLFRFCPDPYIPFNPANVNKYVVGDDYLPLWMTRLNKYYANGYSMKNSFDAYLQSVGSSPETIWNQVEEAIRTVLLEKETAIIQSSKKFKQGKFFEMMRFDFVIDDKLNVFLMEANMSPNLSSAHFPPNLELYEQVLYALYSTIGLNYGASDFRSSRALEITNRQIMVNGQGCGECLGCTGECLVCSHCLTSDQTDALKDSMREHFNRINTRRVFPPAGKDELKNYDASDLTQENQMLIKWFSAKCTEDPYFCY